MSLYGGIDVGLTGAIAIIDSSGRVKMLEDTPTFKIAVGLKNKSDYDIRKMATFLLRNDIGNMIVGLESVNPFPIKAKGRVEGVVSMFTFGRGLGIWEGIIAASGCRMEKVRPQTWKKVMLRDMGKEKDAARLRACQLFPSQAMNLSRIKDHGRAEALLIAEFMRRTA